MKFGVFFLLEQPEWTTQARVYADVLAQAEYADALGYDSVWLAEHHFSEYGICPSMAVLMGALVARRGEKFLSAPSITPVDYMKAAYATYARVWREAGHPPDQLEIPALYFTHVGADATATRRDTERSILWYFATLARVIAGSRDPAQVPPAYRFYARAKANLESVTYDFLAREVVLFGEAERVIDRLAMLRDELGLTLVVCWLYLGGWGVE